VSAAWFDELKRQPVAEVAERIGWAVVSKGGKPRTLTCPACGRVAEVDSANRPHGADITFKGVRWYHASCGGTGTSVDVLAAKVVGHCTALQPEDWKRIHAEAVAVGLCQPDGWQQGRPSPPAPRVEIRPALAPPTYPPEAEVLALWDACLPVTEHTEARRQLLARKLDPVAIADHDLARALPPGPLPGWAHAGGRSWAESRHVVVLPFIDCNGRMASLQARRMEGGGELKALSPTGYQCGGLLFAGDFGRNVLTGGASLDVEHLRRAGLLILEGVADFLGEGITTYSDADENAPAYWAILSGSWRAGFAGHVPPGVTVYVATHADKAGIEYAKAIEASFPRGRVKFWPELWRAWKGGAP